MTTRLSRWGRLAPLLIGVVLVVCLCRSGAAISAEIDGIAMPALLQAAGTPLKLNGMGVRTYSMFRVHIYVAGLYLEHPSNDAEAILRSDSMKMMDIRFVHDVDAAHARDAWVDGFRENCRLPCQLPDSQVKHFLSQVPDFRKGDQSTLLFTAHAVSIAVNGRLLGIVTDDNFARAILATFIGVSPPSEDLKRALLGLSR